MAEKHCVTSPFSCRLVLLVHRRPSYRASSNESSNYRSIHSAGEYVSAIVHAQVTHANGEVIRQTSLFIIGENRFDRADYKIVQDGTALYKSMVCTNRNGYWLSWTFAAQSEQELDDVVNTLQNISFDRASSD